MILDPCSDIHKRRNFSSIYTNYVGLEKMLNHRKADWQGKDCSSRKKCFQWFFFLPNYYHNGGHFSIHGSYNLEKVLNCDSGLEKSWNSVKVLEKYLISLLGLEKSLKFVLEKSLKSPWNLSVWSGANHVIWFHIQAAIMYLTFYCSTMYSTFLQSVTSAPSVQHFAEWYMYLH